MSSKGKRSSILKKQNCYPPTDDPVCPVETFSSALKSSRKIEFNRKKSVKEFLVGEDVDTIWGNSYEVSTDGTPSNGLEDATLEHSSCPSTTDEQNKENRVQNKSTASVDESLRRNSNNSTNNSWDLSITISDEEKRGIRNDTSAALSQSLNTTERLRNLSVPSNFLHSSQNAMLKKSIVSGEESEVLPMDVSPMKLNVQPSPTKSPRKMIYNFPKQAMFVEINDIPATLRNGQVADPNYLATISSTDPAQNVVVNNQIEASWLDSATVRSNQTNNLLRRSIEDSTETFNSHPHWNTHLNVTDKANESSDVDTTIALTAAMTKVLESRSNASIYKATNMDLDESTTTVPTNALARARPSFLPSNHSEFIESKNTLHTPSVVMHGRATSLTTNKLEETKPIDISSPLEEHVPRRNMSFENLSILNNMEQSPSDATRMSASVPLKQIIQSDVTSARGDKLAIDFGFSSLSLKLGENSPEVPSATKPRILRPTMPMAMFDAIPDNKETMKSHVNDEINRIRSTKHTARTALTYEKSLVDEMRLRNTRNEIALDDDGSKKSIVAMETSNLERKQSLSTATHVTMHATTTIGMEQSMGPRKQHRSTVIDSEEVQNNPDLQRVQRATMVCNEQMDLTHDEQPVTAATSLASSLSVRETMQDKRSRQSVYNHEPMLDETMAPQPNATGAKGKNLQHIKRETVLGVISMDEMNNDQVQSPQTALNNFRKTHYPRDKVHENAVPVVPDQKTIICNESMMMDVCVTPEQKSGLSCIVYAQNADKLSVHAVGGGGQIDMNIARPTTFQLEPCDESTHMEDNNHRPTMPRRQTVMQTKNMILSEEVASTSEVSSKHPTSRLTEHVIQLMEEDGRPFELPGKVRQNEIASARSHGLHKSVYNADEMEITLMSKQCEKSNLVRQTVDENPSRYSTYAPAMMDETITEKRDSLGNEVIKHNQKRVERDPTYLQQRLETTDEELQKTAAPSNEKVWQQSRIPKINPHHLEVMNETTKNVGGRGSTRHSIYNREDMDVTRLDMQHKLNAQEVGPQLDSDGRMDLAIKNVEKFKNLNKHSQDQYKSRASIYERVEMDATCMEDLREDCETQANQHVQRQAMVSNDVAKESGTSHTLVFPSVLMNGHENALMDRNSRKSNSVENVTKLDNKKRSRVDLAPKGRPSSYHVEEMDESNYIPSDMPSINASKKAIGLSRQKSLHEVSNDANFTMHDSPGIEGVNQISTTSSYNLSQRMQRVRQSIHHPQEMETTLPDTDSSRETDLKAPTECYALRKLNLQTIVQQVPIADLEGIELLADDEVVPKEQQQPTVCKRGTIVEVRNMIKSDSSPERRSNHRQTIYDPHGMMEETLPMRSCVKLGQKKSVSVKQPGIRRPTRYSQRISNDYMEETIIPENVRVEHNPKIRLSTFSRDSVALESPIVCQAEHPPSVTKHQPQLRRAIYSTEETVDAPTAVNNAQHRPGSPDKSRQTIQQAACMDMTLGCKEIDTTPSKVQGRITNRRTIYNPILIEETPPYHGSKAQQQIDRSEATVDDKCSTKQNSIEQPVEQQFRRPRQTILVPQDMDVDDDMPLLKEEERSFALSVLPREATEDCVLRSAPVLSIRGRNEPCNLLQELSIDSHAEFAKPSHLDADEIRSRMVERQTVNANEVRRTFQTQELSDISMPNTTIQAELLPHIGSIVGMESMHEVTELLPPVPLHEQNNSVSVICRVDGQQYEPSKTLNATTGLQPMAFATGVAEIPSEDEFFDAEEEAESHQPVDPLSLTKSRHLTMKFVDVEQLERTKNGTSMLVPATTTKRLHKQVLCSPVVSRLIEEDPLQMTTRVQSSDQIQHTPQGPAKKRPRTSAACTTPPAVERAATGGCLPTSNRHPAPEIEEVVIKEEQQTLSENVRLSQTIIHDPSVFAIEDEDLLDDESNLPCISNEEISTENGCSTVEPATSEAETRAPQHVVQRPSTNKLTDLSYYRDFANLTIDNLDSWNDEKDDNVPDDGDFVTECISLSDEDSRSVTPPKAPRANSGGKNLCEILKRIGIPPVDPGEVLESTIASEIMNEIRQQHPIVQHPCCGMQEECLCRPRRQLKRDQEYGDLVWDKWSKRFEALLKRIPVVGTQSDQQNVRPQMSLEVHIEELNWQLMRGKLDETFLLMHDEFSKLDISSTTRRSRSPIEGQYPETPSVVFLAENMRSCLVEQTFVDTSPPTGAPLPEIPQILHLIGNKLFCDSGTRWLLDYTEESDKHQLLLRHRTLRSVVVAVQLQPPRSRDHMTRQVSAHWRLERIQVRECQEEYVHSPKLLLAHIEFMRLAKETTERTLRSTYRTVTALMGLWHRFDELLRRVFDAVNRLLTIVRNNEALLCYDAQMERFCVKKYFHRCLDEATLEPNLLQVHFNWIGSIGASGVSYKRPLTDSHKLLPMNGGSSQHAMGANPTKHAVTDDKTGLMFLECLLWNVAKQYHS